MVSYCFDDTYKLCNVSFVIFLFADGCPLLSITAILFRQSCPFLLPDLLFSSLHVQIKIAMYYLHVVLKIIKSQITIYLKSAI